MLFLAMLLNRWTKYSNAMRTCCALQDNDTREATTADRIVKLKQRHPHHTTTH